jgi:protease PrsW
MADPFLSPDFLAVMVVSAFALPLIFVWWIRNTPRYGREPMSTVLRVFGWGAIVSLIIAGVLEFAFIGLAMQIPPLYSYLASRFTNIDPATVFGFLVAAPLIEEASKALGVRSIRRKIANQADGLVYGATAGLGFSAMENLLYGLSAYLVLTQQGLNPSGSLLLIALRSLSSSLLHASATATTGFGLAKSWLLNRRFGWLPFFLAAVSMHATFNFLTALGSLYPGQLGGLLDYVGFLAAVVFAITAITLIRLKLSARRAVAAR